MDLTNKIAWITGGGSGIGRATALRFAQAGAKVAILGRAADELQEVANRIDKQGGQSLVLAADISVPADIDRAARHHSPLGAA